MDSTKKTRLVVCIANEGCEDPELRKLYEVVSSDGPEESGYVRVVDDSGEDYLYPSKCFLPVELPEEVAGAVLAV